MSTEIKNRVIMSADIVGSTALYEAVGDAQAQAMISDCLNRLKSFCAEHHGKVIAEVGDQIIAVFADPTSAASAASEIHVEMHELYARKAGSRIRMRVGLHHGPVPDDGDPLVGETNRIANWAADKAKPDQTLATRALVNQLPRIFRAVSRYVDDETWNFVSLEHIELYEIIWDVESITAYNGEQPARDENSYSKVVFRHGDREIIVDGARPVISIGRHKENDLVIHQDLVSRQHLSAQFSRGRCTITDNSTNGSLVTLDGGETFEIKRESIRLSGCGQIVAGKPGDKDSGFVISFRCE